MTYQGSSVSGNKVGIWIRLSELGSIVTTFVILIYSTLYHNNVLQIIYFPIMGHGAYFQLSTYLTSPS